MEFLKLSTAGCEIIIIIIIITIIITIIILPSGMGKDFEWESGLGAELSR
jgi:hypothetical protein